MGLLAPAIGYAEPPAVTAVSPRGFTRGQAVEITVTGDRLDGATGALVRIPDVPGAPAPVEDPAVKVEVLESAAKSARLRLTASAQAEPGVRELRVISAAGISNARSVMIGAYPEVPETEPNGPPAAPQRLASLPVTVVGRVQPADEADQFVFPAQAGQHLIFDVDAVALEATLDTMLTLRDTSGRLLAINDDADRRDPWLAYRFERAGDYVIEIRDTGYRAGADAVYRLTVGALSRVTGIFPLGGRRGSTTSLQVDGINLSSGTLAYAAPSDASGIQELRVSAGDGAVARRAFLVEDAFELTESEPNDTRDQAREVTAPVVINGRADRPGDIDSYKFLAQGRAKLVFEVFAQRLGSSYDSYLSIVDSSGKELGSNDDGPEGADSYREITFPTTADYWVRVRNLMSDQGGPGCAYRLVVRTPTPGFDLQRNLPPVTVSRGGSVEVPITITRQDGWQGPVNLSLKTPPELFGVGAEPVTIQGAGREGRLRITATPNATAGQLFTVTLRVEGTPGNQVVTRERPLLLMVTAN